MILGRAGFAGIMIRSRVCLLLAGVLVLASAAACAVVSAPSDTVPVPGSAAADPASAEWLARGGCHVVAAMSAAPATSAAPSHSAAGAGAPIVLTVRGHFAAGRHGPAKLNLGDLDAMTQVECSVDDRLAEGRQVTFRGVLLTDVLASIGAQPSAVLHTAALNDYAVDLPLSDIRQLPLVLATRLDGAPMSVAHYGPLRIIYPTTGYHLDPTTYDPRWIWQLSSIDVS